MKLKLSILGLFLVSAGSMQARFYQVKNDEQCMQIIQKHSFAVVGFVDVVGKSELDARAWDKNVHALEKMMKKTSDTEPYKKSLKSEIAFMLIDSCQKSMESVVEKYNITGRSPQFILFKEGKVITDVAGKTARLFGFVTSEDLADFIATYLHHQLDEMLAEKSDQQAQEREAQLGRYDEYAASRYPYGGYAPYNVWGSPSFDIYTGYAAFYPYGYSYNGYAYRIPTGA